MMPQKFTTKEPKILINDVSNKSRINFEYFFIHDGIEQKNNFKISLVFKKYISTDTNNEKLYQTETQPVDIDINVYSPKENPKINMSNDVLFPFEIDILEITVSNDVPIEFDVDIKFNIL